jgi:hypothetical protein
MPRNVFPIALLVLAVLLATVEIVSLYSILSGTPLAISYTTSEGGAFTYTRSFGFILSMSAAVSARLLYRQRKA